jgi:hypothetical protein
VIIYSDFLFFATLQPLEKFQQNHSIQTKLLTNMGCGPHQHAPKAGEAPHAHAEHHLQPCKRLGQSAVTLGGGLAQYSHFPFTKLHVDAKWPSEMNNPSKALKSDQ